MSTGAGGGMNFDDLFREAQAAFDAAAASIGKFNLAIFGKTGAGKSTLINGIFGAEVAATGTGRPVTVKTEYYEHPSGALGIYDSEGIEVGQEGDEILARFRQLINDRRLGPLKDQIHVIWYCVRAGDLRFEDKQAEFVAALAQEQIPVLFVLTQTPIRDGQIHPEAQKLASSVIERGMPLSPENRVFFTMAKADDFLGVPAHGLQELLDATFRVAPSGVEAALIATQVIDLDRKASEARKFIQPAAAGAAAAGATPIPFSDAAILVPIQMGLMAKIAAIYGLAVSKSTFATLAAGALTAGGVTQAGKYIVTNLLKFVPGGNIAAGAIRAGVASSLTYAVGEAWLAVCAKLYKLEPSVLDAMDPDHIKDMFMTEFKDRAKRLKPPDDEGPAAA